MTDNKGIDPNTGQPYGVESSLQQQGDVGGIGNNSGIGVDR